MREGTFKLRERGCHFRAIAQDLAALYLPCKRIRGEGGKGENSTLVHWSNHSTRVPHTSPVLRVAKEDHHYSLSFPVIS